MFTALQEAIEQEQENIVLVFILGLSEKVALFSFEKYQIVSQNFIREQAAAAQLSELVSLYCNVEDRVTLGKSVKAVTVVSRLNQTDDTLEEEEKEEEEEVRGERLRMRVRIPITVDAGGKKDNLTYF